MDDAIPSRVARSVTDPARVCPVLSGTAWLHGDRLHVRSGTGRFEVDAPQALLLQLCELCDGTQTRVELEERHPALRGLLESLLARGVLVDAALHTLRAAAHGQQGSCFGRTAQRGITAELCHRFKLGEIGEHRAIPGLRTVPTAPLADMFMARISSCSFANGDLSDDVLTQFAWSIAGVVRNQHEMLGPGAARRTLGSAGGMHLLQVHLVLQRPAGSREPAVYRVLYPAERMVVLQQNGPEQGALRGAFIKPERMAGATGAVFISADGRVAAMRYGNRALQYLLLEAGAALQNAALTAAPLGVGFSMMGGYVDEAVRDLCAIPDQLVLGCGLFGPALTTAPSRP